MKMFAEVRNDYRFEEVENARWRADSFRARGTAVWQQDRDSRRSCAGHRGVDPSRVSLRRG